MNLVWFVKCWSLHLKKCFLNSQSGIGVMQAFQHTSASRLLQKNNKTHKLWKFIQASFGLTSSSSKLHETFDISGGKKKKKSPIPCVTKPSEITWNDLSRRWLFSSNVSFWLLSSLHSTVSIPGLWLALGKATLCTWMSVTSFKINKVFLHVGNDFETKTMWALFRREQRHVFINYTHTVYINPF